MQAMINIELMNSYNIKKIVTTCPHDFNTLKNEYKSLGGDYKVYHHTEYILKLIETDRLTLSKKNLSKKITYHDPCYLGRGNNIYNSPRELIKSAGFNLLEMKRSKKSHFVVEPEALKCLRNQKKEIKILILKELKKQLT